MSSATSVILEAAAFAQHPFGPADTMGAGHAATAPPPPDPLPAALPHDEFLAVVMHELRSPLNAIRGWAHVLRQGGTLSPLQLKALDAIDRNTVTQARLVDDLLDSQRMLRGELRPALERVCLAEVVNKAVESVRPSATVRRIDLHVQHDTPDLSLLLDAERMTQALVKVLTVAMKLSEDQQLIRVHTAHQAPWAIVQIRNEAAPSSTGSTPSGSFNPKAAQALGLSLATQLVKLHGGHIETAGAGLGHANLITLRLPERSQDERP